MGVVDWTVFRVAVGYSAAQRTRASHFRSRVDEVLQL